MQNGEDVIANVKEIRENAQSSVALAYEFEDSFSVMIQRPVGDMFLVEENEESSSSLESLKDMKLEFFPWAPLSTGRNIVTLLSVVSMSEPHANVLTGYQQVLEQYKTLNRPKNDAEIDYSQTPPTDLLVGETNGDG